MDMVAHRVRYNNMVHVVGVVEWHPEMKWRFDDLYQSHVIHTKGYGSWS